VCLFERVYQTKILFRALKDFFVQINLISIIADVWPLNSFAFKLIQARLRNMNRTNNSSSLASSYSDFVRSNELSQEPMEFESQPEMPGMLGQQTATICFTLIGNLLMIFVILRNNFVLRRKRITPVRVISSLFK
jgi:hypothetical protein